MIQSGAPGSVHPSTTILLLLLLLQASSHSSVLTDDVRSARQRKLADVIISNKHLQCADKENTAVLAASLESTLHKPGMTAAEHSAALRQLVSAIKSAQSWLDLPAISSIKEQGLAVVIRLIVDAAVQDAAALQKTNMPKEQDVGKLAAVLSKLATLPVTAAVLEQAGAGGKVKGMRKHRNKQVAAAACHVIDSWRSAIS